MMNLKRLISENGKDISLGRTTFWVMFVVSLWYWVVLRQDTPNTLFNSWWIVLLYNFGKKGINVLSKKVGRQDGTNIND